MYMNPEVQAYCLNFIVEEWKALHRMEFPADYVPSWGVWICQFEPINKANEAPRDELHTLAHAWFLTKEGLEEKNP
jgi:hypothetical protein